MAGLTREQRAAKAAAQAVAPSTASQSDAPEAAAQAVAEGCVWMVRDGTEAEVRAGASVDLMTAQGWAPKA